MPSGPRGPPGCGNTHLTPPVRPTDHVHLTCIYILFQMLLWFRIRGSSILRLPGLLSSQYKHTQGTARTDNAPTTHPANSGLRKVGEFPRSDPVRPVEPLSQTHDRPGPNGKERERSQEMFFSWPKLTKPIGIDHLMIENRECIIQKGMWNMNRFEADDFAPPPSHTYRLLKDSLPRKKSDMNLKTPPEGLSLC